jgi:hypothetical protein
MKALPSHHGPDKPHRHQDMRPARQTLLSGVILELDPIGVKVAMQASWRRRSFRHGPACPGYPNQHSAAPVGPDEPGHDE